MVIRGGRTAILMLGAGGILSGCALPFAGPLVFTDILTGVSIFTTAATGKGATEIALDVMTGKDCRFLEGALREDRDICEEPGSQATDEDFKGIVAWLEDNEPASPLPGEDGEAHIMVADIGLPDTAPERPVFQLADGDVAPVASAVVSARPRLRPQPVASLSELPDEWIVLASAQYGPEIDKLGAIAPASGASGLIHAKLDSTDWSFMPAARTPDGDLADWATEKLPAGKLGIAEHAFTWPSPPAPAPVNVKAPLLHEVHWDNLWPAVDIENPSPLQEAMLRDGPNVTFAESDAAPVMQLTPLPPAPAKPVRHALLPPAPAKPSLQAFLPHPKKPSLQAALPGHPENARAEIEFPAGAPDKPQPEDGPVLALLPANSGINRTK